MQLAQELTFHVGNMKDAASRLKAFRPPKWLTFAAVIAAFVAGWLGGWSRGMADYSEINVFSAGSLGSIAAQDRAEGKQFLTERLYRDSVDKLVQQHVQQANAEWIEKFKRLTSPAFWLLRGRLDSTVQESEHKAVVRYAEQRLALVVAPTDQTKQALAKLNRSYIIDEVTSYYINTAADYSALLGRQIRPDALVTDTQIQERISFVSKGY